MNVNMQNTWFWQYFRLQMIWLSLLQNPVCLISLLNFPHDNPSLNSDLARLPSVILDTYIVCLPFNIMSGNTTCLFHLRWKLNTNDLFLFIINLFLSNQGKILQLSVSRLKIKFCMSLPMIKMLVSSAKSVSLMSITLLILVSISLT